MPPRLRRLEPLQRGLDDVGADRQELEPIGAGRRWTARCAAKPVSTLRAVTVTPGSAPPLASVTVPTMVAVVTWALATGASGNAASPASSAMTRSAWPWHGLIAWLPSMTCIEASTCVTCDGDYLFATGTIFLLPRACQAEVAGVALGEPRRGACREGEKTACRAGGRGVY